VGQKTQIQSRHHVYFDYLRIMACLTVMIIHVSGQNILSVEVGSYPWLVFNLFNKTTGWSVWVFIMISGSLFLDNERPLNVKKLYCVNLVRILTAYLFWSGVYALEEYLTYKDFRTAMTMLLEGRYHLWYLLMTCGLYIVAPVFRKVTESREATEYFLVVTCLIVILYPEFQAFLSWARIPHTITLLHTIQEKMTTVNYAFPVPHVFYFVLGFYLHKYPVKPAVEKCIYVAAVLGFCFIVAFSSGVALVRNEDTTLSFTPCVLAMSAGIFLFAKNRLGKICLKPGKVKLLKQISGYTFGAYLVHALVLSQLRDRLQFTTLSFDPLVSVILLELCVAVLSFAISMVLNTIPVLRKYIV